MSAAEEWIVEPPGEVVVAAERIRASGVLGKPGPLSRLFEFLLARSGGRAPKELEIAIAVFNKKPDFDIAQDALVRVYVHKLRRRLEEHYLRNPDAPRISIPKGEYRLLVEPRQQAESGAPKAEPQKRMPRAMPALAFLLGALLAAVATLLVGVERAPADAASARSSPVWSDLLADDLPVTIVVGDSEAEFIDYPAPTPDKGHQHRNARRTYLPIGTALALADLSKLLAGRKQPRIELMSELDGETLLTSHVIYIGYLSGLGMLGDLVRERSRLQLNDSGQVVDSATGRAYAAHVPGTSEHAFVDYGYFATLRGPVGNRIIVVAGTRDAGVMQSAVAVTDARTLAAWTAQAGTAQSLESLTEVKGVDRTNLSASRIFVAALH